MSAGIFCRKVPGTLNSCNNQNCFSRMGVDTYVKKGGCYETASPRSVGDCGCGSANISQRALRANLHAHAGIGGTRGSARAFATTRTHYRRDHAFLTTSIDGVKSQGRNVEFRHVSREWRDMMRLNEIQISATRRDEIVGPN